jgi:CRP/FNR family transcriptional regulator, cyclic AMP receptor protein
MVQSEAAERFLSTPLLQELDPKSRRAVFEALVEERAAAGSVLLAQGQVNDHLSFLIEGNASIERRYPGGVTEGLATLNAPTVFGTTSFFTPNAPTFGVRATTDGWLLTLYHPAHERLRRENLPAAEALALATIRVLSERFNELDRMFSDYMASHPADGRKATEWAGFRARLFEEVAD